MMKTMARTQTPSCVHLYGFHHQVSMSSTALSYHFLRTSTSDLYIGVVQWFKRTPLAGLEVAVFCRNTPGYAPRYAGRHHLKLQ